MPNQNDAVLDFLLTRRSRPAKTLTTPAPDKETLMTILSAASRTPDHGKLEPWRFIVLGKNSLTSLSSIAEQRARTLNYDEVGVAKACKPFIDGPLAVAVIEVQKPSEKIPAIEKTYSAGAACLLPLIKVQQPLMNQLRQKYPIILFSYLLVFLYHQQVFRLYFLVSI